MIRKKKTQSKSAPAAEEPKELEITQQDSGSLMPTASIVRPMISAEQARIAWKEYQDLKKVFLDPNLDYQVIQVFQVGKGMVKKPFIKKSGWRKLATAFNISVEIVKEERKEHTLIDPATSKELHYFAVEVTAKAIGMNGRYMVGTGTCASNERQFGKLEHDIRATAETRAKNRAISDLIGGGEVSAEELEAQTQAKQNTCSVDHDNLPDNTVKTGKNEGRHYVKCLKCNYWAWIDGDKKVEETESIAA